MHNYYSTKNQTIIHFLCYKITKNYDFGYAGFKEFRQHISSLTQSNRYLSHIILMRLPCNNWRFSSISQNFSLTLQLAKKSYVNYARIFYLKHITWCNPRWILAI